MAAVPRNSARRRKGAAPGAWFFAVSVRFSSNHTVTPNRGLDGLGFLPEGSPAWGVAAFPGGSITEAVISGKPDPQAIDHAYNSMDIPC